MSNRFVLESTKSELENVFSVEVNESFSITPNYNISAGTIQPIIIETDGVRKIKQAKWGLLPPDAEDERAGKDNCVFAYERLQEDEWPGELLETQRTLVVASGFYKWKTTEKKSTPFYVRPISEKPMGLGGLYTRWKSSSGREVYSFALLSQPASALIEPIDDRMPLLVRPQSFDEWLNDETPVAETLEEIESYPSMLAEMIVNRVSEKINDINNSGKELIQPIPK